MPFINDEVFDQGLDWADTNGTRIDICSTDPGGTYATVTANTLGNDTVNTGTTSNAATGTGRRVTVPAITAGSVTGTGTATHWALTNGTDTVVASGALTASQSVTSGNTFTLDAIDIIIRDAT
jgi:hypothetical protein